MSNPDKLQTIYVSKLPWTVRDSHLKSFFEPKGAEITDVFVVYRGKKSRGFGYVTFSTAAAATKALEKDGSKMAAQEGEEAREISVVLAKPRSDEAETAAKERLKARAEKPKPEKKDKPEGDDKPAPKPKEGKGKKEKKEGGKGGKGAKKEGEKTDKPAPKEKKAENGEKKKDGPLQFNIGAEHMEFLKGLATKYDVKGLNSIAKALLDFAGTDDPDMECFKNAPESKPEKLVRLRLNLTPAEIKLVEAAQEKHSYPNRHIPMQALIRYVTPSSTDPAEKGSQEAMLDDIMAKVKKAAPATAAD